MAFAITTPDVLIVVSLIVLGFAANRIVAKQTAPPDQLPRDGERHHRAAFYHALYGEGDCRCQRCTELRAAGTTYRKSGTDPA
jgi:hypothetical protein